jgi:hypothetical protein
MASRPIAPPATSWRRGGTACRGARRPGIEGLAAGRLAGPVGLDPGAACHRACRGARHRSRRSGTASSASRFAVERSVLAQGHRMSRARHVAGATRAQPTPTCPPNANFAGANATGPCCRGTGRSRKSRPSPPAPSKRMRPCAGRAVYLGARNGWSLFADGAIDVMGFMRYAKTDRASAGGRIYV